MINDIAPDISALIFNESSHNSSDKLSDALSVMLYAALYNSHENQFNMLIDILPYVSPNDKKLIGNLLLAKDNCIEFKKKQSIKRELKKGCLSPDGNLSNLICVLKDYSSLEGRLFLSKLEKAIDTARIIGALKDNPSPYELMRFMGMGDSANILESLPKIMQMFSANE